MFPSRRALLISLALSSIVHGLAGVGAAVSRGHDLTSHATQAARMADAFPWAPLIAVGVALLLIGVWITVRARRHREPPATADRVASAGAEIRTGEPVRRELQTLNEIAVIIARGADLISTVEQALDVVRRANGVDAGLLYRVDHSAGTLVLVAQRGLDEKLVAAARVMPSDAGPLVEAAQGRRVLVTDLDTRSVVDDRPPGPARSGAGTQLALPVTVAQEPWGVVALISRAARAFTADELAVLDAVVHQIGLAVERAQLQETASARLDRLEAQRQIERRISEQRDLEELLIAVAESARRLIGGEFSIVYLREGDVLRPRAWTELPDWVREAEIPVGSGVVGTAFLTERGFIVNDYQNSELALPRFKSVTSRLITQPLLAGGRALGVMTINRGGDGAPFTSEDLAALADFATQAAVAIENARLFAEAKRAASEYQALFEVAGLVGSTLDVERVLDLIVDRCCALMGVASAGVFALDEKAGVLTYQRGVGLSPDFVSALRVSLGEGTTGKALRDRVPVWTADILEDSALTLRPETRDLVLREGYRSVLSVPILRSGESHGVLSVYWWDRHVPSTAEISVMSALAGQAAIALENARLYGAATTRGKRLASLARLTEVLTATLSLEDVLNRVVDSAVELFGSSVARLWLMDEDGRSLSLRAHAGMQAPFVGVTQFGLGEGLMGLIVQSRAPLVITDLRNDPRVKNAARVRAEGTVSFAGAPLILGDRVLGALSIAVREVRDFSDEDLSLLHSLANHAAVAIENARVFAEERSAKASLAALLEVNRAGANRLRTLARLSSTVSSSLDADAVLQAIATAAAEIMNARFVSVYVADEASRILERRAASDGELAAALPATQRRFGEGLVGWVAEHRRSLDVPDVLAEPRAVASEWARVHGLRRFLGVPIIFQDSLLGVLTLSDPGPSPTTPDDERLLESFVNQAAVAIRNTRLYARTAERLEETRAMLEVAESLNATLDPTRLLKQVAIKIAQVCRVDRCTIEHWDGDRVVPLMSQFADGRTDKRLWTAFVGGPSYVPRTVPAYAQAIETRRPVVIADTSRTDLIPRQWAELFGQKSSMVVPLIRQDAVIGVMSLDYVDAVTPFERWQADRAMAIAGQLALTIENTRLFGEAQKRLWETSTLLSVAQVLSRPAPAEEVMRLAAREVTRAFGADVSGIYLVDERTDELRPVAGYHIPKHALGLLRNRSLALTRFPLVCEAWRTGRAFWSSDMQHDPRLDTETLEGIEFHSVLFAPTMVRGQPVGALFLAWRTAGREFQPDEIRLIEGVASQVGLAMENADLARQTQQKLDETERLLSVSRTLASTLDLETLPREFLHHVVGAIGADTAGVWLLDGDSEWMEPVVGYHVPPERLEALSKVRLSVVQHPFYAEAVRTRRPMVSIDMRNDLRIPQALRDAAPHRTHLFVPIVAKDRVIGGFAAGWWDTERRLGDSELRLMEAIASQAGVALDNARLFRDNQRRVEELSVLHELSRAVTGQLDQAQLLDTIERQVARVLAVEHLVVLLHDELTGALEVVMRLRDGIRQDGEPRHYPPHTAGLSGIVLDTGRPIRTDDYTSACLRRRVVPAPGSAELPHWLGVPMKAGNQVLGVLVLRSRDRAFTDADQRLLSSIADLAALALRSARLYEERTRAFSELRAAQDQLVRTEKLRAMGEMASGVAHDFNNVLSAILGRAQLMLTRVEDPKLRQWIHVIERATLDGARTVRRLQDFTRIRRDHPVVPMDVNQVVQQTLEATESSWRQESRSRGIEIDVVTSLAAPLPEISGDPAELREALTNLVLNALDAMPGGGTLALSTRESDGHVEVTVRDTGTGIPAAIRHKIFDPFFTTKGPKGTGLGLSMTYGIIARHGGRISVESEEGHGATFRLIFPISDTADERPSVPPPIAVRAPSLRCLVVDDEEAVATVLGDMLLAEGHRVDVVDNGQEALERFREAQFDLVLTDLAMPGMSGWEVARAIKDVRTTACVVLVTGFGVELSGEDLRKNSVDLVLAKPVRLQDIESAVALARGARPH
jgi:GAF domain-containing protein/CheY-like chemotaxis protein